MSCRALADRARARADVSPADGNSTGSLQTQTGFPLTVTEGTDPRHPVSDACARSRLRSERWSRDARSMVRHGCSCGARSRSRGERNGNEGPQRAAGPGFSRTDLSLFKNIRPAGPPELQLRVEAFNVFNQARFASPAQTSARRRSASSRQAEDGRIVQLGIRIHVLCNLELGSCELGIAADSACSSPRAPKFRVPSSNLQLGVRRIISNGICRSLRIDQALVGCPLSRLR